MACIVSDGSGQRGVGVRWSCWLESAHNKASAMVAMVCVMGSMVGYIFRSTWIQS